MHFFKHLHTVNKHRRLVRHYCFKAGLYYQGLIHDLSKYSPTEFLVGAKYYQGNKSPNAAERIDIGVSNSWMHHKGRNRHHYEYWTDYSMVTHNILEPVDMPTKYLVESICDRIAASKVYEGKKYTDASAYTYFSTHDKAEYMHPNTHKRLEELLVMLKDKGEKETFVYMKQLLALEKRKKQ